MRRSLALHLPLLLAALSGCADGPTSAGHRPFPALAASSGAAPAGALGVPGLVVDVDSGAPVFTGGGPAAPDPLAEGRFDPAQVTAVLDDPRLAAVKAAVEREAYARAVAELTAALAARPGPSTDDGLRWLYQLGRLRALAGDLEGAVKAFDAAAAATWPLSEHARFASATWLGKGGHHAAALLRAQAVPANLPVADLDLVIADALVGTGDMDGAAARWRTFLGKPRGPAVWVPVAIRFSRALLARPSEAHAKEAVALARRVLFEGGGTAAGDAKAIETEALGTLPFAERKRLETPTTDELVARSRALLASGQHQPALKLTDTLLATPGFDRPGAAACDAWLVRGDALGKLRRRGEAADAYRDTIDRCAGLPRRVEALFAGGRASERASRPPEAAQRFALVEKEFPAHSFADDARVRGAKALREAGDEVRFAKMLGPIADDYPAGDLVNDGLFELALARIERRDWAGAIAPLEKALARAPRERHYAAAGRVPYYLGRARIETGAREEGVELLVGVIREHPLSLYMSLAHARLHGRDPAAATKALEEAVAREPEGALVIPVIPAFRQPAFLRAVELARQGEAKLARAELDLLGFGARTAAPELLWAAAFLFARAGSVRESHQIFRGALSAPVAGRTELTDWTLHYPRGQWRAAWELAYPRPFAAEVAREASRSQISEAFAYAIMREESAFDPRVVSPANAYGLMQLIPATAASMARPLSLPHDAEALKRPEINVALGCRYLSVLRRQFADNPLLAIPGYNAGGNAPKKWVAARPGDDFDVFIERIPYEETRMYTKRVLGSLAAYEFLYGPGAAGEALRLPAAVSPAARAAGAVAASP